MQIELNKPETHKDLFTRVGPFIWINLLIAFVLMASTCPSCFLSLEGLKQIFPDFAFSFCISSALSYGGTVIIRWLDQKIPWVVYPFGRLFATVGIYMAYSFVVSFVFVFVFAWITDQIVIQNIPWGEIFRLTAFPMQVALIIMAIFTTWSWLGEWRKSAVEAERLKAERFASQYQSLKDQLNPHFLFNSLNVLTNLVYEDADRSAAFIQKLSKIYRYVLEVQQEELVSLEKELDFAKNFLDLQKIRFEENLQFRMEEEKGQQFYLPPLSLQLLLENAIKHNVASKANPLFIDIRQKGNELWVSNTLQLKNQVEESSTGIGLENILKRYKLLNAKAPTIRKGESEFLVILPLIKIEQ